MLRIVSACCLAMALGACQTTGGAPEAERPNAFAVTIDAERLGVIIDHATDGAQAVDVDDDENATARADVALKSAAVRLIVLRNEVCRRRLLKGADCVLASWPAWTLEPPSNTTPIETIQRRTEWLSATMDRFTAAGCKAGVASSKDEQFCSVE